MRSPTKGIGRYLAGILVCEGVLLFAWIGLGDDASATGYTSVQSLLNWIGSSQPQDRAFMLLAASAIRSSSRNVHKLTAVVLVTSGIVIMLSIIIALKLRRREIQKNDASSNA